MFKFTTISEKKNCYRYLLINFEYKLKFEGIMWSEFCSSNPVPIPHPCDLNVICKSVDSCWRGSKSLDGLTPQYKVLTGEKRIENIHCLPGRGYWLGNNVTTKNVEKARRAIFVPAYTYFFFKVLSQHYDWYQKLLRMQQSKNIIGVTDKIACTDWDTFGDFSHAYILAQLLNSLI